MHGDAADVIRMRLEHVHPLQRVVVENPDLHVVLGDKIDQARIGSARRTTNVCAVKDDILTAPVMTQFFLATNLAALTGRSHTSNVFTKVYGRGGEKRTST